MVLKDVTLQVRFFLLQCITFSCTCILFRVCNLILFIKFPVCNLFLFMVFFPCVTFSCILCFQCVTFPVLIVCFLFTRWSYDKAVSLFMENTALGENAIRNEVRRYITWPGQVGHID